MLRLYNSLGRKITSFEPLTKQTVKLYVCGITPYDTTHLGHAFTYMTYDVLIRYLQFKGHIVHYTQNVTDIDDDLLVRAKRDDKDWQELGTYWTEKFLTDIRSLNMIMPTKYIKATDSISTILSITEKLMQKGFAYEKNGIVYFSIKKFPKYGNLSRYTKSEMIELSKERGANPKDPNKQDPLDFILWQISKPGEPSWVSPWGNGRPGWHIECSAMIYDTLGEKIDIHGGGFDLIYPHHDSEIAQSESFTSEQPFVTTWMHTAMLKYQGEKMSKSLGNLVMVSELLKKHSPNTIRYVLLSHHYRKPWEFYEKELVEAEEKMGELQGNSGKQKAKDAVMKTETFKQFIAALEDDLNTPHALKILEHADREIQQYGFELLGFL